MAEQSKVSTGRVILAFILDFVLAFVVLGYGIAMLTGGTTEGGFELNGGPALIFFALLIAYFVGMGRYGGGTIFQRLLGTKRK